MALMTTKMKNTIAITATTLNVSGFWDCLTTKFLKVCQSILQINFTKSQSPFPVVDAILSEYGTYEHKLSHDQSDIFPRERACMHSNIGER